MQQERANCIPPDVLGLQLLVAVALPSCEGPWELQSKRNWVPQLPTPYREIHDIKNGWKADLVDKISETSETPF